MVEIKQIKKRDGRIVDFDPTKISEAIWKAAKSVGGRDRELANKLASQVVELLKTKIKPKEIPTVEQVQDLVEKTLVEGGHYKTAKAYILYRQKRAELRKAKAMLGVEDDLKLPLNSIIVLERRYLRKDESGKIIETPKQMFERVAGAIASVEKLYKKDERKIKEIQKEFFDMMVNLEFLPNSPTLMNAGTGSGLNLSACFTADQPILSNPEYKMISELNVGDKVVTHTGVMKTIKEKMIREIDEFIFNIKVKGLFNNTLSVTGEHPILAVKAKDIQCIRDKNQTCNGFPKSYCFKKRLNYKEDCRYLKETITEPRWIPVKELEEGDYVVTCTNKEVVDKKTIKISDILSKDEFLLEGNFIKSSGRPNKGKLIPNIVNIDKDFMRLIGYWLADGSISGKKPDVLRFTFGINEKEFYEDVINIMSKKFNLTTKKEFDEKQNTVQLRFHSTIVAQLFYFIFGRGFSGKDLPDWVMLLPYEKQFNLMVGLFRGDGCHHNGKKQDIFFISLSNRQLAIKVWNILMRLGYNFNIKSYKPKGGTKEAYRISIAPSECEDLIKAVGKNKFIPRKRFPQFVKLGGYVLRPITKIEKIKFKGKVYNLEVEDDHSYVANGVAVHNCFVIPVEDDIASIFEGIKTMAIVQKAGGGTGFSFSRLRPAGDIVKSTSGVASGPISFMQAYDAATEVIKQGGKRRGANMGILRVDHPDILDFIVCKEREGILRNFNISVAVTDKFMNAVEKDEDFSLINPRTNKAVKTLKARAIWNLILTMAWKNGEPGVIFIDTINKFNPTPQVGQIESTNPCGEQPLLPYESCNLGSINLAKFVEDGKINWERLKTIIRSSVRFLDNVIDANVYPIPQIEEMTKKNRKIGLGVMGFAEMLIQLGIPYDSEEALKTAEEVMKFISEEGRKMSVELGKEKGSFPNFKGSAWEKKFEAMRNATVTTIAPTGTISVISNSSSGIEPLFAVAYVRDVSESIGAKLIEINPLFESIAIKEGFYSDDLIKNISGKTSIQDVAEIPKNIKRIFVTAHDIAPEWHVRMQAAFQKYTDNAVSKTLNFPNSATPHDIEKVYMLAYKLGCKGITVYRSGSRAAEILKPLSEDSPIDACPLCTL